MVWRRSRGEVNCRRVSRSSCSGDTSVWSFARKLDRITLLIEVMYDVEELTFSEGR